MQNPVVTEFIKGAIDRVFAGASLLVGVVLLLSGFSSGREYPILGGFFLVSASLVLFFLSEAAFRRAALRRDPGDPEAPHARPPTHP